MSFPKGFSVHTESERLFSFCLENWFDKFSVWVWKHWNGVDWKSKLKPAVFRLVWTQSEIQFSAMCELWSMSTGSWSNLDISALKIQGKKSTETAGRGEVGHGRGTWWCGGEQGSRGSINHCSCWFILTLQSHWASTVNVLSGILCGSIKKRAWLNTYIL